MAGATQVGRCTPLVIDLIGTSSSEMPGQTPYHMRRLSWAWGKAFEGSGLAYTLVASSPAFWQPDVWWRDEMSGAAVIMEYIKLAYYLVKY